ncbi:MAG: hypothetical protein R3F02_05405 [Thiolinea sp.]
MSSEPVNVDWLNTKSLKSVTARRFAEFCAKDFSETVKPAEADNPDTDLYKEAARLVIERIEAAVAGGRQ